METNSFALLEFDTPMTMLQQKLYYLSAALIKNGDDPEENQLYQIDIRDMAKATNVSSTSLRTNMEKAVQAFADTNINLRKMIDIDENTTAIVFGIYQSIVIDKRDPYKIQIRFNYDFRKKMLQMKKLHDIEYPVQTILGLRSKYAISLYIFLVASASIMRDEQKIMNGRYDVRVTRERLIQVLQYDSTPRMLHDRALKPACKQLNEDSEIYVEDGFPEIVKNGKSIAAYILHIRINTTVNTPIFSKPLISEGFDFDIPQWDYLLEKAKEIGADKALITTMKLSGDRRRVWKSILYTLLRAGKKGNYLNTVFYEGYASEHSVELLIRTLMELHPEFKDDTIEQLDQEYDRQGKVRSPVFIKKLLNKINSRRN